MQNGHDPARHQAGRAAALVSVAVNLVLTCVQVVVGLLAHSQALVADAIHTFSDLVADGVVLAANSQSRKGPDAGHQYGHLRFETAASMVLGVLLMSVAATMLWRAYAYLQNPGEILQVHPAALIVALLAIACKETLFRYMVKVGERVRSTMLVANAWHARSDAASSLVVAAGIVANLAGFPMADPLAALVVGLMIARMGWKFFSSSFADLMDRAVDAETQARIREHLLSTPGVLGIHDLKTRKLGDMIWVEVHIEMDGGLSIAEGHEIAVRARARVMENEHVLDVTTHFDPVDPGDPRLQR